MLISEWRFLEAKVEQVDVESRLVAIVSSIHSVTDDLKAVEHEHIRMADEWFFAAGDVVPMELACQHLFILRLHVIQHKSIQARVPPWAIGDQVS